MLTREELLTPGNVIVWKETGAKWRILDSGQAELVDRGTSTDAANRAIGSRVEVDELFLVNIDYYWEIEPQSHPLIDGWW